MANIREYHMNGTLILGIDHGYGNIKTAHRQSDDDNYILTLAAIAKELNARELTSARVHLADYIPAMAFCKMADRLMGRMCAIYCQSFRWN